MGCDLRGNDLSAMNGTHHLKRVVIERAQLMQLAEALAAELNLTFGDDLVANPLAKGPSRDEQKPGKGL
jgi:hypothetical protein